MSMDGILQSSEPAVVGAHLLYMYVRTTRSTAEMKRAARSYFSVLNWDAELLDGSFSFLSAEMADY